MDVVPRDDGRGHISPGCEDYGFGCNVTVFKANPIDSLSIMEKAFGLAFFNGEIADLAQDLLGIGGITYLVHLGP